MARPKVFEAVRSGWCYKLSRRARRVVAPPTAGRAGRLARPAAAGGLAYLIEENRILRGHVRGRIRLTEEERRRLAVHGHRLGRRRLRDVVTIVTPDTILRWHRQLIALKWTYRQCRRRPGVVAEIRRLVVRMAEDPDVGLHADPRRTEERPPSGQPVDDCADRMRGSHQRPFFGIAPTGRAIAVEALNIYHLSNGQIVTEYGQPDMTG